MKGIESFDDLERYVNKYGGWDRVLNIWFNNSIVMTFGLLLKSANPGSTYNKDTKTDFVYFDPEVNYDKDFNVFKYYVRDGRGFPVLTTRSIELLEGIDFLPEDSTTRDVDITFLR